MSLAAEERLRQRSEYTYKHNVKTGRHGWMRLTPAYSVRIVEELIASRDHEMSIYDPFSGTATTALSAAYHGHQAVTTDINPFLVWLGQAKTARYTANSLRKATRSCDEALRIIKRTRIEPAARPPIHNIERWWNSEALTFLCSLKAAIQKVSEEHSVERTLLLVAFCRTLIALSNAAFNHQSMSFKSEKQLPFAFTPDMSAIFLEDMRFVLDGAADNPTGSAEVILGDARNANQFLKRRVDCIITSPPYANRMSYIRELRPYMYWLDYLTNGRDAGELDWTAIGGTWGVATSRLGEWTPAQNHFKDEALKAAISGIACEANQNGRLLANYVGKYFDDMWQHFQSLTTILSPGAEVHYIVGNSTFYGVLLPVERIYAAMLASIGFSNVECKPIRKRNSKKELVEFDVTAKWRD